VVADESGEVGNPGTLLMTKRRVGVSSRIGLRDPRSQKRDLGHPSISPFDIAEGTCFVISLPTRFSESAAPNEQNVLGDRNRG